jgi:hypothetical protein
MKTRLSINSLPLILALLIIAGIAPALAQGTPWNGIDRNPDGSPRFTGTSSGPISRDLSLVVGTSPVQVSPAPPGGGRLSYLRTWNVSSTATVWCSRNGNAAAVNGAGSFPLGPGQSETWQAPQDIPQNTMSLIATATGTPVTIEVE